MTVCLNAKPVNIECQVYALTSAADEVEIETFYETLQDIGFSAKSGPENDGRFERQGEIRRAVERYNWRAWARECNE